MDQREAILNAAMKRFAARGYRRTTMDEVAAEVGLGTPALYYYFASKMDLFKAVVEREGIGVLARLQAAVEKEADPVRQLRAFCLARFHLLAEQYAIHQLSERVHREIHDLCRKMQLSPAGGLRPPAQNNPEIHDLCRKMQLSLFRREAAILEEILQRGMKAGIFKPVDRALTAALILQTFRTLETPWGFFGERSELEGRVDFALSLLLRGLEARP